MPYTKQEKRTSKQISDAGDLNYAITLVLLAYWRESPHYQTIHNLRKMFVIDPKNNPLLQQMRRDMAETFTVADIYAAAANAYQEFSDRIVKKYEKKKRDENGDLPEYVQALKEIEDAR